MQQTEVPGYETVLATWTGRRAADDGVPAANLLRRTAAGIPAARRFAEGDIDPYTADRKDGAELAVLGTASDDPLSQLRAGEALSAVLLTATTLGLGTCPLSQPLEIGTTRRMLRGSAVVAGPAANSPWLTWSCRSVVGVSGTSASAARHDRT